MQIFQKGFNFRQDGPGNRLVYHLQGCNMRCIWCSNPEGMEPGKGKSRACSVEELFRECMGSRMMFFGGGGVTFTGGEATLQADELKELLEKLQVAGIHTAIETNATSPRLIELVPYIDYLIMDFKHYDSLVLKQFTGMGNEGIKANFEAICAMGRQVHVRIPLINGFNADNPEGFAAYFASQDTQNAAFEFLPYHEYGKDKWKTPYMVQDGYISEETLQQFKEVFKEYGLNVIST